MLIITITITITILLFKTIINKDKLGYWEDRLLIKYIGLLIKGNGYNMLIKITRTRTITKIRINWK